MVPGIHKKYHKTAQQHMQLVVFSLFSCCTLCLSTPHAFLCMFMIKKKNFFVYFEEHKRCFFMIYILFLKKDDFLRERKVDDEK